MVSMQMRWALDLLNVVQQQPFHEFDGTSRASTTTTTTTKAIYTKPF